MSKRKFLRLKVRYHSCDQAPQHTKHIPEQSPGEHIVPEPEGGFPAEWNDEQLVTYALQDMTVYAEQHPHKQYDDMRVIIEEELPT